MLNFQTPSAKRNRSIAHSAVLLLTLLSIAAGLNAYPTLVFR